MNDAREPGTYFELDDAWSDPGWTRVPNSIVRCATISRRVKGWILEVASHAPGRRLTFVDMIKMSRDGRDATYSTIKEAMNAGFVTRTQDRDANGRKGAVVYRLHVTPQKPSSDPLPGKPYPVEPEPVKPETSKKTSNSKDQTSKEQHQTPSANADASTSTEPEPDGALFGASERVVPINQKADAGFDRWWGIYPRREGKQAARKSFDKALRAVDLDRLCAGAERYARHVKFSERRYIKQPTTWLNQGCWDDELGAPPRAAASSGAPNRVRDFKSPALEDQGAYDEAW